MSQGTFQLLTSDWDSLSDTDKLQIFTNITGEATVSDLISLGRFKVVCYSPISDMPNNLKITAVPKDQIVLPNKLISLKSMSEIFSIGWNLVCHSEKNIIRVAYFEYKFP